MIDPGFARTIARGAGFVGSFLIGQPTTGSFVPIDPASNWGYCRKNRKFVGWSCYARFELAKKYWRGVGFPFVYPLRQPGIDRPTINPPRVFQSVKFGFVWLGCTSNGPTTSKKFVWVVFFMFAPLMYCNRDNAVFHLWHAACMPRPRACAT